MGVEEYFAYDSYVPPLVRRNPQRLFGWHLDREAQQMRAMHPGQDSRLWSSHLDSFLVPDGKYLRLYDQYGHLRLTGFEAQTIRAEMEESRARMEALKAEVEAQKARIETRRAEAEAQRAEMEARRANALADKLRKLGIDPDQD